ncbi:MAG TPA: hypothetical protein P5110_06905 [Candidatus Omnitrophota bacterium]|nr:hypothetical protein [Candidatus Omnitrophota bacterium]
MFQGYNLLSQIEFKNGLNTSKNLFNIPAGASPGCLNVDFKFDGIIGKRAGYTKIGSGPSTGGGWGLYDCGMLTNADSATVLLMHFESWYDDSPGHHVITTGGNNLLSTAWGKTGFAKHLLSATYGAQITDDMSDFNFLTGDFCLELFASLNDPDDQHVFLYTGNTAGNFFSFNSGFFFGTLSSPYANTANVAFIYNDTAQGRVNWFISQGTLTAAVDWHHYVLQRSSNSLEFFLDGRRIGTARAMAGTSIPIRTAFPLYMFHSNTGSAYGDNIFMIEELVIRKKAKYAGTALTVATTPYESDGLEARRLLCANGDDIIYSDNLGQTFTTCQTSRSLSRNHFALVKKFIINTNDSYDDPQYWAGTAGTYFANISTAAPTVKYMLSHQGYCIGLNEQSNKNSMYYIDENDMFTGEWDNFALPTAKNDEITGGFILNKTLYISTKYKIFRMLYVGGNPDWSYYEIKNFGFVPETMKKISIPDIGEVVVGLDFSRRLRLFDGTNDRVISDNIENDNGISPFSMSQIEESYLHFCWAENDVIRQVYKLYVPKSSSLLNYCLVYDYRNNAFYPYDNQGFYAGVVAADSQNQLYYLTYSPASGALYRNDTGTTDNGVAINDYYISPLLYNKTPILANKLRQMNMFFSMSSSGNMSFEDRCNLGTTWFLRKQFELASGAAIATSQIVDLPETVNVYQFKLSSSANTANPWELLRTELTFETQGQGRP